MPAKRKNTRFGRLQTATITFIPPLICAIFFAQGFILALAYAAIFIAILEVIMPAAMVFSLRRSKKVRFTLSHDWRQTIIISGIYTRLCFGRYCPDLPLMRVLVTRPKPLSDDWCRQLGKYHIEAIAWPCIEIETKIVSQAKLATINKNDFLFFISANAVDYLFAQLNKQQRGNYSPR